MAKKVAVPEDEENKPIKKKRSRCCTCCLVFLIVMLVIFGAAFGVGWYFGDKFTKENFGMSLSDTFGVLNDLYWTDDGDVVKNPYNKKDLDGFYTEVKRNILLRDDADVDFDAALSIALDNYLGGKEQTQALSSENAADGGTDKEEGSSVIDIFVDMIAGVLDRDNIDIERLNAYDENDPSTDEYIFHLKDKQLAAFVNSVLKSVLKDAENTEMFKSVADMIDLSSTVSLKQIRFKAKSVKEGDSTVVTATTADITVWVGLQKAAGQALKYFLNDAGFGWASGLVGWMGNVILPENLYVTMSMPLFGDGAPEVTINDMNKAERARANKLIDGILKMTGSDKSFSDIVNEFADSIKPYLEKATEKMSFDNAAKGEISLDLLGTMAEFASGDDEVKLTKSDFIYLLQALLSDYNVKYKELLPYRYKDMYLDGTGKEVYIEGGSTELTPIDYERRFIDAIEDKYALDFGDSATLAEVLEMLGISVNGSSSSVKSTELLKLIDAQKLNASLDKSTAELELIVTDRMLAAAMSEQMDGLLTGGGTSFENLRLTLDALTFVKKPDKPDNLYALLAVEINISDVLGDMGADAAISKIASGLMPEKVLMTMTVDITRSRAEGAMPDETEFMINSCQNTDRALGTLEKLMPSLNLQALADKTESMLNDMLDQMYKKLNIRLVASTMQYSEQTGEYTGEQGGIVMPDIFSVVTDTVLVRDDGSKVVTPDELKSVLGGINDTSAFGTTPLIADDYSAFISQVVDKYYLNPSPTDDVSTFDGLTEFMNTFDTGKFRVSGNDNTVKYIAYDTRPTAELRPIMTDKELGALLAEQMKKSEADVQSYRVMDVKTSPDSLTVVLAIAVKDLLPDDVGFLLTADNVYVTATVDLSRTEGEGDKTRYPVSTEINSMDGATFDATMEIVKFFKPDFDIQAQVDEFGVILYERLDSLNDSISFDAGSVGDGELPDIPTEKVDLFEFTNDGLIMIDFYTFLANKMKLVLDEATTSDTVKSALQGMYMRSEITELYNESNYLLSDFMCNMPPQGQPEWTGEQYVNYLNRGGTHSDIDFNGFFKYGVEAIDPDGNVRAEQTVVLHSGDGSAAAESVRTWANARLQDGTQLSASGDYMLVTFSMTMDKFMDTQNSASVAFYPETVYATIVYEKTTLDGKDDFTEIGLIFNNMTNAEYNVIVSLMSLSADASDSSKINIVSIAERSAEVLDDLAAVGKVDFGGVYGGEGIGSVVFTPTSTH